MPIKPIGQEEFLEALTIIGADVTDKDKSYLYEIYTYTVEGIENLTSSNLFSGLQGINHLELIGYCVGEYKYYSFPLDEERLDKFQKDESVILSISSIVADKYLSLSQFSYQEKSSANRFTPPISTLYVYVNFMQNIVKNYQKKDPKISLLADLFMKSISICKCTLDLLVKGFETEAFSCWRTLHECECALIVLVRGGNDVIQSYLKHMQYSFAFRNTMSDKEKQNEIFLSMKEEMRGHDLKSKDIKKYIEYGWLYSLEGVANDETFKLNFRDGLEKIAGLEVYNKRYEMSSEIIHGTPLLVYSNDEYFYFVTLLSTYESFFRLEQIFFTMFTRFVSKEQAEAYRQMRQVYYTHLVTIHKRESESFKGWKNYQRSEK